jgi:hypothetical protein
MNRLHNVTFELRSEHDAERNANQGGDREPVGFFARLTAEQQAAMRAYRGDETVGDVTEAAEIKAAAKQR